LERADLAPAQRQTVTALDGTASRRAGHEASASKPVGWLLAAIFVVLAGLEHYLHAAHDGTVLSEHGLADSDSYMRVLRIIDLYNGSGWYDTITMRLGAPEGLSLHWTRPVDVLILLPALAVHLFGVDVPRTVYWVGVAFSTIFHILACLAVTWAARPLWPSPGHRFAAVILFVNGAAFGYGEFGRADHHTVLLLLTVLMMGAVLRASLGLRMRHWGAMAGLYGGLGIWISPEMMISVAPAIASIGLFWLLDPRQENARRRDWAAIGAAFALAMAAVVFVAIPIEHPPAEWLNAEFDKLSMPYLVMALLWFAVFTAAGRIRGGLGRRAAAGILLAGIAAAALFALYPGLIFGPMGQLSERSHRDFLDGVQEMQPLWPTSALRLRNLLVYAGQSVAAILLLPFALRIWWRDERRLPAIQLVLVAAFLLIAALMHARLNVEFAVAPAIICSGFFTLAEIRLKRSSRLTRIPALALVAVALTVAPFFAAAAVSKLATAKSTAGAACPIRELADWMNTTHPGIGPSPIVLTDDLSYAPELAFRTGYRFVAGPYHRGAQAMFDAMDALTDTGGALAREIVDKRRIALVIRCTDTSVFRLNPSDPHSFYAKLGSGDTPDWLKPLALPMNLSGHFKVYEVVGR
jgi:hypothetical protein